MSLGKVDEDMEEASFDANPLVPASPGWICCQDLQIPGFAPDLWQANLRRICAQRSPA